MTVHTVYRIEGTASHKQPNNIQRYLFSNLNRDENKTSALDQ